MKRRSVVGPKGQITIPKELRERYHLLEGEDVMLAAGDEGVLVKHAPSALRGRLRGKIDLNGLEDELEKIRANWSL